MELINCPKCEKDSLEFNVKGIKCKECGYIVAPGKRRPIEKIKEFYVGSNPASERIQLKNKINEIIERFNQGIK